MFFVEYVLLAVLGSIAPGTSASVALRTYDAESVSQPRGSARSASENKNSNTNKKTISSNKNAKKPAEKGGKKGGTK